MGFYLPPSLPPFSIQINPNYTPKATKIPHKCISSIAYNAKKQLVDQHTGSNGILGLWKPSFDDVWRPFGALMDDQANLWGSCHHLIYCWPPEWRHHGSNFHVASQPRSYIIVYWSVEGQPIALVLPGRLQLIGLVSHSTLTVAWYTGRQ